MKEFYRPTGKLGEVLEEYQAPDEAMSIIGRRAALVVERGQLPIKRVKEAIVDSMCNNNGLPNWKQVSNVVGKDVNNVYRKSRRSW